MSQFLRLPSGTVINLALIRKIVPGVNGGVSVTFALDDIVALDAQDADFLAKRLGNPTPLVATVKGIVFWVMIAGAILLVYLAVQTGSRR